MRFYGGVVIALGADLLLLVLYISFQYVYPRLVRRRAMSPDQQHKSPSSMLESTLTVQKRSMLGRNSLALSETVTLNADLLRHYRRAMQDLTTRLDFAFEEVEVKLKGRQRILSNINGHIGSARVTASMGPSGAGKVPFFFPPCFTKEIAPLELT
jgi:hypothetical protein